MKDLKNREAMARIYRLIEKYEVPPVCRFADEAAEYYNQALADIKDVVDAFPGNDFVRRLGFALFDALDDRFHTVNGFPLTERDELPGQQSMFQTEEGD